MNPSSEKEMRLPPPPQCATGEVRRMGPPYDATHDHYRLARIFKYHRPIEGLNQQARYQQLREQAKLLAGSILREVPPSSERENAIFKIEEAIMWANAGIARGESLD